MMSARAKSNDNRTQGSLVVLREMVSFAGRLLAINTARSGTVTDGSGVSGLRVVSRGSHELPE